MTMTPIQAASVPLGGPGAESEAQARAIILAFLDAAAGDEKIALRVGKTPVHLFDADWGKAAITALKDTING